MIHTTLDDAFASMMQFMSISTRKCKVQEGECECSSGGYCENVRFHVYYVFIVSVLEMYYY